MTTRREVTANPGIWVAAAAILLLFAPGVLRRGGRPDWLALAETPLDRTSHDGTAQWIFLCDAAAVLPAGASYTILAATPDEEMNLFMISLGLCVGHQPYPNSYFGIANPGLAARADYVLDFGCAAGARSTGGSPVPGALIPVRNGCVVRQRSDALSPPSEDRR